MVELFSSIQETGWKNTGLVKREEDKYKKIPHDVAYDVYVDILKLPVYQAPENTAYQSCCKEHKVARG